MIELYKPTESRFADAIEDYLKELVVAYKVVPPSPDLPARTPWVRSGKELFQSEEEIKHFLDVLTREVNMNIMVSGDACFVDPEKGGPCL